MNVCSGKKEVKHRENSGISMKKMMNSTPGAINSRRMPFRLRFIVLTPFVSTESEKNVLYYSMRTNGCQLSVG